MQADYRGISIAADMTNTNLSFVGGCVAVIVCDNTVWLSVLKCVLLVKGAQAVFGQPLACVRRVA